MMTQTQIQVDKNDYEFIEKFYKKLLYQSPADYICDAVRSKIVKDREKIREMERSMAIEMIGKVSYSNFFESLESEDFENC